VSGLTTADASRGADRASCAAKATRALGSKRPKPRIAIGGPGASERAATAIGAELIATDPVTAAAELASSPSAAPKLAPPRR
jgi:hypothetical protein